jgi:hypothetical protein
LTRKTRRLSTAWKTSSPSPRARRRRRDPELFREHRFNASTQSVVDQANTIIAEYIDQGFTLTLRQLFYQFVARDLIQNTRSEYKRVCRIVGDARDAGLIDWDAIEDRTREVYTYAFWDDPSERIRSAVASYREDLWAGQDNRPEVWIEKDALLGVIEGVCGEFRTPYFATRGNCSQTLLYAGQRFAEYIDQGLIPQVIHLADHDPNGIDMTRDIRERLELYTRDEVEVSRLALNMDQVRRYRPPANFAKRFAAYKRQFGTNECWELDALSPTVIADLIRGEIESLIDTTAWDRATAVEKRSRRLLDGVATNWTKVEKLVARTVRPHIIPR